jgi:organic hydroperoxide reductase OsmC/OhrA
MSEHKATIIWERGEANFLKGRYSREHTWTFDGGITINASAAPSGVPLPYSNPDYVDPEEVYVAAISSCHMLMFLFFAYKHGFQVDRYFDEAIGVMTKNEKGVFWVSQVTLRPKIKYGGDIIPSPEDEEELHHISHEQCFISNSIKTEVILK